jgi:hypothetical protein
VNNVPVAAIFASMITMPNDHRQSLDAASAPHLGRGRVARPFGFALTDPGMRISRARLFPEVTRVRPHVMSKGALRDGTRGGPHADGTARGNANCDYDLRCGHWALAIVGGLFVAVCIEALVAPKEKAPHEAGPVGE